MTIQTFDFQKSSRWTLFKMLLGAFIAKRLSLSFAEEQKSLAEQSVEIKRQADEIDIRVMSRPMA